MKVMIVHAHEYGKGMGGARRYFQLLYDGLKKRKVDVTFLGMGKRISDKNFISVYKGITASALRFDWAVFKYLLFHRPEKDVIIHVGKIDTLLPFFLLLIKNKKILTADTPFSYMHTLRTPFKQIIGFFFNIYEGWAIKRISAIATDERTSLYYMKKYPYHFMADWAKTVSDGTFSIYDVPCGWQWKVRKRMLAQAYESNCTSK